MIHRFSEREPDAYEDRPRRSFIGMLFRRRVVILVSLGLLLIVAITLVLVLPRQFQSSFDILVRNKLPLSARINTTEQETVDEERMQSEVALIHSPELAAKVVDPDYPAQPDATHTAADLKRHQASLSLFSQQLITTVAPNSNLIHVVVTAEDPHRAADLASRLLDVFFASQSEVAHPTAATSFFLSEADHARGLWQEAQLSLDAFLLAHPPTPTGPAAEIALQVAALNHQIQRNDEQIDATIGRILAGERKLITIPAHPLDPRNKSRNRSTSMPLLTVAQLNAMLAIYNDEQAILLTRPPTDPEAVRASLSLATQITETTAARRVAEQSGMADRDPSANSLWQATTDDIAQASTELKSLYTTRSGLSNQLSGFQASLDQVQRPAPTLALLKSKAASLQSAFRLADQRANEARIADAMDQQLRLNVAVASRPSFSNTATSPSPWLYGSAIALAVLFLAACLTLFAGMYANEYETDEPDEYDQEEYDDEDPADSPLAEGYAHESHDELQEQIPFPSRIRSSPSGAFLYAAPGASIPQHRTAPENPVSHIDPVFEPIPSAPSLSEILSTPAAPPLAPDPVVPSVQQATEPEADSYPSPAAQIFHPRQYIPEDVPAEETNGQNSRFEADSAQPRHASGETHAAVPSFFAAPPSGPLASEHVEELVPEPEASYPYFHTPAEPVPVVHEPVSEPAAEPVREPNPAEEAAPIFSAIPTAEPEPVVTLPDPTPPWSQPAAEPVASAPSGIPPLSYWASIYESAPAHAPVAPEPDAPNPEPVAAQSIPEVSEIVVPQGASVPVTVEPEPVQAYVAYVAPQPPVVVEPVRAVQEPVSAVPFVPEPQVAANPAPSVNPKALPQSFTTTARPDPFLTGLTSTLSSAAFRFTPAPPRTPTPPAVAPAVPVPPVAQPVAQAAPPAPAPAPKPLPTVDPVEAPALAPDPELILSYAPSAPLELVPDPVLPPVKPPYQVVRPAAPEPAPEPARVPPSEFSEFPLYRAPKPAEPVPPSPPVRGNTRPQTYEEMVKALVFPEETAPYIPPSRPAAPRPPVAQAVPASIPAVSPQAEEEAPPFHYARRSVPEPVAAPAPPPQDDYEALQSFIRRPSVPLQPAPEAPVYQDDRTTYHQAAAPVPPVTQPREPARSSWIDLAPPPPPRAETLDPQKRPPDRISAIRDQTTIRSSNLVDESGRRLTPSERMKRGRPVASYDKDGKVTYTDQDKTRY